MIWLSIYDLGWVLVLFAIAVPLAAAGGGIWLVCTGLERKSWWFARLIVGAPLLAYGGAGIVFMTL